MIKPIGFITKSISNSQFGFLQRRSTLQQLLIFLTNIYNCLNDKTQTDVVYLDFRKAFDSVPHYQLLSKLWTTGISGNLWRWFKPYPSSRTQCVSVNSQRSCFLPVLSGVPQGSILGPYSSSSIYVTFHSQLLSPLCFFLQTTLNASDLSDATLTLVFSNRILTPLQTGAMTGRSLMNQNVPFLDSVLVPKPHARATTLLITNNCLPRIHILTLA